MYNYSKFHIIYPLKTRSAHEVAVSLEERVLAYVGTPRIFHSDNGRWFVSQVLAPLFEQWVATQPLSMAGPDIRSHRDLSKEVTGQFII